MPKYTLTYPTKKCAVCYRTKTERQFTSAEHPLVCTKCMPKLLTLLPNLTPDGRISITCDRCGEPTTLSVSYFLHERFHSRSRHVCNTCKGKIKSDKFRWKLPASDCPLGPALENCQSCLDRKNCLEVVNT
jgi:hypothetical protein